MWCYDKGGGWEDDERCKIAIEKDQIGGYLLPTTYGYEDQVLFSRTASVIISWRDACGKVQAGFY